MAYDTSHLLQVAQRIAAHHEASPLRFWPPRLTWQWLGVAPRTLIMDEYGAHASQDSDVIEAETTLSAEEVRQGMASVDELDEKMKEVPCLPTLKLIPDGKHLSLRSLPRYSLYTLQQFWNNPFMLRIRLSASKTIRNTQHSSHLRHAMKNAIGVAMLSFPAFLPPTSSGLLFYIFQK